MPFTDITLYIPPEQFKALGGDVPVVEMDQ